MIAQHDWMYTTRWFHDLLHELASRGEQDVHVVCESFVITQATIRKSRQLEPVWATGAIMYLTRLYGYEDVTLQSPSQAKSFSTDHKLKKIDWWRPGLNHGMDAARHLLLYLVNAGQFDISRFTR